MEKKNFDVIVIGGGPGGYVAAIRASQRGQKVALVEANAMGGVCLNCGCIPSKTLISNAEMLCKMQSAAEYGIETGPISFDYGKMCARKDKVVARIRRSLEGLISANGITVFSGFGKFLSPHELKVIGEDEAFLEGQQFIVATGSRPAELNTAPFDHKYIHDSTSFLELKALPEKVLIIGGGVVGCEFASMHRALGVDVTIVELLPMILSTEGKNISDVLTAAFLKKGIKVEMNTLVEKIEVIKGKGIRAQLGGGRTLEADMALVSCGRKVNTENIGLEKTGVIIKENGTIPTNDRLQTNIPHIYAIGDITGKWILAHVASHQGLVAADNASGHPNTMHYNAVPSVIFTNPEIGTIGLTLERAIKQGYDATLGHFPFQALGKAQAAMQTEGFAQVVTSKSTGQILGAQVVGHEAATLIAEMAVAIGNELTISSISDTIHAHPTIAEAWMEAALIASDMPLHFPPKRNR